MTRTFFARFALPVLCVVFFLVPFALRGARMSLERMQNNVKDWLPETFKETKELEWFAQHFVGQQAFIVLSGAWCVEGDERLETFQRKLKAEIAAADEQELLADDATLNDTQLDDAQRESLERRRELLRARVRGDELGLFTTGNFYQDWGGRNEKWLRGNDDFWYYITPEGELFRWGGRSNVIGWMGRSIHRLLHGKSLEGEYLARFGSKPFGERSNDFHSDPRKLTARVLKSVTTGPEIIAQLTTSEDAPLWPRGVEYSAEERPRVAHERAVQRLTGSLFGPEPFEDAQFRWDTATFRQVVKPELLAELPEGWEETFQSFVDELVEERFDGDKARLLSAPLSARRQHWHALFHQWDVEPPRPPTCILVTLSEAGSKDFRRVIGRGILGKPRGKLIDLAVEAGITPPPDPPMSPFAREIIPAGPVLRMGGPPVDNVAIDEEGQITLARLVGFSIGLGIVLSYLCFRSIKITIMVFFVGGISAVASLSIVWWLGSSVDAILMSMPSLVYVLGLSGAVHIVNYYRDAVQERGLQGAPERALSHGWGPCTLAAFTTALGLLSLYKSNIFPIKKFGLFSAIGVMATLVMLFLYLPAALELWPPRYEKLKREFNNAHTGMQRWLKRFWTSVGSLVVARHGWVLAGFVVLMIVAGWGLTRINTSIQLLKLFDGHAKIIRDYQWLEANLGKLVPMELVARVDRGMMLPTNDESSSGSESSVTTPAADGPSVKIQYTFLDRMELAARIQREVEDVFGENGDGQIGHGVSAATFAPPMFDNDTPRRTLNYRLAQSRQRYLDEDYLKLDEDGSELWRISLRLAALADVDYGQFVGQLRDVVEPVMSGYRYRERLLEELDQQLGPDNVAWTGAAILVLGAANPHATSDGRDAESETPRGSDPAPGNSPVDQTAIFARTLDELLRNDGFRGMTTRGRPKQLLVWHDPATQPLPEDLPSAFSPYHSVVLASDHPSYDVGVIRGILAGQGKTLVDARDHRYDAAGGSLTANERHDPIRVVYTGVVPIVYKAQRTLLVSLMDSIAWAFVMIALVMTLLLRDWQSPLSLRNTINVRGGLLSMLPNLFPVVLIFGFMGYRGISVDIGSMMTASVAMGVAVDDTIHFLAWFRQGIRDGLKRRDAIIAAYDRVAAAMTQTTLIGGLGLSVFAFSTFTPTQRFGVIMLTLLIAALAGDLLMLPALLASPLGRYFCPKVRHSKEIAEPPHDDSSPIADRVVEEAGTRHSPIRSPGAGIMPVRKDRGHARLGD